MEPSVVEELRLTSFKSFQNASLPLDDLTLLVGRNGSGKSNALDGLWVLSRLAMGEDIRDTLDGGRDGPAVRGGVDGCAPFGQQSFQLGCKVRTGSDIAGVDVTVQTEPVVQVTHERLWTLRRRGRLGDLEKRDLLLTDPAREDSSDIVARWDNQKRGTNPPITFRASRLLTTQVVSRVPATVAGRVVHEAAARVLAALRSVFVLDPVPHQMRQYVPRRDIQLRRNADNLSAAVAALLEDPSAHEQLRGALESLNEQSIVELTTSASDLDDVMLTLKERWNGYMHQVPARLMSDGSLRFLAILVALLQAPPVDSAADLSVASDATGQTTLVIEELENGLHPSQAHTLISFIRDQVKSRRIRVLATAHSPALLDALTGGEHRGVLVCQRRPGGLSTISRLVELPTYVDIVAKGGLGRAAVNDRLRAEDVTRRSAAAALDEILGRSRG
jgi:predicted ATPase